MVGHELKESSEKGTCPFDLLPPRDENDNFSSGDENDRDLFKPEKTIPRIGSELKRQAAALDFVINVYMN